MKGWRTLLWSLFLAAVGVIQAFDWTSVIPADSKDSGYILMIIGAVTAALRYFTTTPVGKAQ